MALYVGITVGAISIALTFGVPAIENMQDAAEIQKMRNFMQNVDSSVQEVASEGEGSARTLSVDFDRGQIYFRNSTDSLVYELETDAEVISPQSSRRFGNVLLSSNADVKVNETSFNSTDCFLMENSHVKACIRKVGGPNSHQSINTSKLLVRHHSKDIGSNLNGNLTVEINNEFDSSYGTGYTNATEKGDFLGTGEVKAHIVSDNGRTYDVYYRLPTGSDFIQVDVQNIS